MTVADNRSDDLKEEGRGCGRGVIGISLGAFSTFVAGSTREGEIKEIIGSDGEQCLRTIFDLAVSLTL